MGRTVRNLVSRGSSPAPEMEEEEEEEEAAILSRSSWMRLERFAMEGGEGFPRPRTGQDDGDFPPDFEWIKN